MMLVRTRQLALFLFVCLTAAAPAVAQVPIEILHNFVPAEPGAARWLVAASDGNVYGAGGGVYGGGFDDSTTVFRLTPGGVLTVVRAIAGARALSESQGVLYGLSNEGAFRMRLDGSEFEILNVPNTVTLSGPIVRAPDGSIYGTSSPGGADNGFVYRLDPQNTYSVVHGFGPSEGQGGYILQSLIVGLDGNVYGTTNTSVFRITPAGQFAIVRTFDCSTDPVCAPGYLVQHPGGDLYAAASPGGLMRITTAGVATPVGPVGLIASALAAGTDGNLYATTESGCMCRVTPAGTLTVIKTLTTAEGTHPGSLAAAPDGTIYGSTANGAPFDKGVVFRAGADGSFAVVHTFVNGTEGMNPNALVQGTDGAWYGTAGRGGPADLGTAYRLAGDGTFTVLHGFTFDDGTNPFGMEQGVDGNFYIATRLGLLRMTAGGSVTKLPLTPPQGISFGSAVTAASDGGLFGMRFGDQAGIYRYAAGVMTTIGTLTSEDLWLQTAIPEPMIEGPDGSLYGRTSGHYDAFRHIEHPGLLFRIPPDRSTALTLHVFSDELGLPGPMALGADGALYGVSPHQKFYRVDAATQAFTVLATLSTGPSDEARVGTLTRGPDGNFYAGRGPAIYRITPAGVMSPVSVLPSTSARVTVLTAGLDGFVHGTIGDNGATAAIFRVATPEVMTLDAPGNNTTAAQPFYAGGWAIDRASTSGPGVDTVHLWAFPANGGAAVFLGAAEYFRPRADVASAYGAAFTNSGYRLLVNGLAPGLYTVVAYAHSSLTGAFSQSRASVVTVTNRVSQPAMNIDIPGPGATVPGSFQVAGWAIDRSALDAAGVDAIHVYAFGAGGSATFLGVASYGQPRTDVGTAYGAQFTNAGFSLTTSPSLAPGSYTLVVYARSTVSGTFFSQSRSLTVRAPGDPLMTIDTPSTGASVSQPFNLAGWAIDRDATSGPGVDTLHVWAVQIGGGAVRFLGAVTPGGVRGDVGAAYGSQFTNSGYNVTVSGLPPGQYQILVYAHSTVTGTFNQSRGVTVTVP